MVLSRGQYIKKNITEILCSIGEFHMVHYQPILEKYAYHRMLIRLIEKHECKELQIKVFISDIIDVTIERDFYEALKKKLT